jgi:ribonuclease III
MKSGASAPREVLLRSFLKSFDLESLAPERVDLALTHRSYANELGTGQDNERLEFLGDAVIASVCSDYLFHEFAQSDEGDLSKLRSHIVSRNMLGKRAREMGMGPLLLLGKGEGKSGGHLRRSLLGSALEALVGVLYLDEGYARTMAFVREQIVKPLLEELGRDTRIGDFKSGLQEWSQARSGAVPVYRVVEEHGPDHNKTFTVEVEVEGRAIARGEGPRIKHAENDAARRALEQLRAEGKD